MRSTTGTTFFFITVFMLVLTVFFPSKATAAEDWRPFLEALTSRRYYDTAVSYLESFRKDPYAPDALKEELDLRIGMLTLEQVKTTAPARRKPLVEKSRKLIDDYLKTHPNSPSAMEANAALAQLLIEEGKGILSESEKATDAEKQVSGTKARETFDKAEQYLKAASSLARQQAQYYQEEKANAPESERNQVYGIYLALRIQEALLSSEKARTWNKESDNYKEGMQESVKDLKEIAIKYHNYAGAINARFHQAKLCRELNDLTSVREILTEFASLPKDPAFQALKTQCLLMEGEMELEQKQSEEIVKFLVKYYDWKNNTALPASYYVSTEGLNLHMVAARSLLFLEEQMKENRSNYNKFLKRIFGEQETTIGKILTNQARLNSWCIEQLEFILKRRHPLALEAEKLLAGLNGTSSDTSDFVVAGDFESAFQTAGRSWMSILRAQGDTLSDPAKIPVTQWEKTEMEFRQAMKLTNSTISTSKICSLQFDWASFCFLRQRYEESAVLANHLCHLPNFENNIKAAMITLHSLRKLHSQATKTGDSKKNAEYLEGEIRELASYIDQQWGAQKSGPADSLVQEVLMVQMETAVELGKIDDAQKLLFRIPESSPRRSGAEMQLGLALWTTWTRETTARSEQRKENEMNGNDSGNTSPQAAGDKLSPDRLLSEAGTWLEKGLTRRLTNDNVSSDNYFVVYAALSLAQISLTQNDTAKTLKWLTHPVIGPLNLVSHELDASPSAQASSPAQEAAEANTEPAKANSDENNIENENTNDDKNDSAGISSNESSFLNENFQMATLILALRTYVAMGDFASAQKTMALMDSLGKGNTDRLIALYIQLGKQLESQLREIHEAAKSGNAAKQKELKEVSSSFERLLEKISERSDGNSYTTLRWVANTFLSLARGISGNLTDLSPEATNYYTKAGKTFQNILRQIKADPSWSPDPNATLVTSLRLAECLRATGRYDGAVKVLTSVLIEKNTNLELQVEGAKLFQDRGRIDKNYYIKAIVGDVPGPRGQNLFWGWNGIISRLARVLEKDARYKVIFYDAYINKMTCRYLYARRLSDENELKKHASESETELLRLYQTHPDMGGPENRRIFEMYLKRFRKQLGLEKPAGFELPRPTITEPVTF